MSRTTRRLACVLVLLALPATAIANKTKAREQYKHGMAEYVLEHYGEAVKHFEAGFREEPEPAFLFNIARTHAKAGNHQEAVRWFKKYLEVAPPDDKDRQEIEARIASEEKAAVASTPVEQGAPAESDFRALPDPPVSDTPLPVADARPPAGDGVAQPALNLTPTDPGARSSPLVAPAVEDSPHARRRWPIYLGLAVGIVAVGVAATVVGVVASRPPAEVLLPTSSAR